MLRTRGFCVIAGRPNANTPGLSGDLLLVGSAPRAQIDAVRAEAQRVLLEMAGPEPEAPQTSAVDVAAAPVEEVAAA